MELCSLPTFHHIQGGLVNIPPYTRWPCEYSTIYRVALLCEYSAVRSSLLTRMKSSRQYVFKELPYLYLFIQILPSFCFGENVRVIIFHSFLQQIFFKSGKGSCEVRCFDWCLCSPGIIFVWIFLKIPRRLSASIQPHGVLTVQHDRWTEIYLILDSLISDMYKEEITK